MRFYLTRFAFQSTPPAWGATEEEFSDLYVKKFQSTPPAWGATFCLTRNRLL